ncbi:peptidase [Thermosipho melanesiensis]|uniref:Ste24 endopeptidase n=1 Tax=Thermosipho melanesiensis (strain DSM 12029 / CIP 104789 / BI429) TaxID=391009 RepID=A6LJX8_THEM4|nr:M48 family metallopeptidase [Thermosipho melanesiensis]ABR30229.1 Ste24 endopeptidase [Thermosipho melanesiensis BI429]OOC37362.1 peptidase [Thermosipho melanesiensis]OOC39724.1 peptidase [Thermosipho melanesiensis]OOC39829.1 peptidase [Thermosipho melanesiensis]OOC43757.1 peptidase [Thermosipho melanesiensis]
MFFYIFLIVFLLNTIWDTVLSIWNVNYSSRKTTVPEVLRDRFSEEYLKNSSMYLKDVTMVNVILNLINTLISLIFIFWGFTYFENFVLKITDSLILQGLFFFGIIWIIYKILSLPTEIYRNFVIEARYGFNTMTPKIFVSDFLKSLLVTAILFIPLISFLLWILETDNNWWWKISIFFVGFQLLMLLIYPLYLAPLFNKFTPLKDEKLKEKIKDILKKASINISEIYVMDASKRTKKKNAFLTGMGKSRRLVLFDTILNYPEEEILAIIAHELGHYKYKHIPKLLGLNLIFYTFVFYLVNLVYNYLAKGNIFNVSQPYSLFVYSFLFIESLIFFMLPLLNYLQRKFEYQADEFSAKVIGSKYMISSLKRIIKENLINLNPLPLYKIWHFNHPSPEERIKKLLQFSE